jgi:hypothetical protein
VIITAGVVAVLSAPVAWWWKVGRIQSREDPKPPLTDGQAMFQHVVGLTGVVVCAAALIVLVVATVRHAVRLRCWVVLAPALVAGALIGDATRWASAPIGDGMGAAGALLELILALLLLGWAAVFTVIWLVTPSHREDPSEGIGGEVGAGGGQIDRP